MSSILAGSGTGFPQTAEGDGQANAARDSAEIVKWLVVRCFSSKAVFGHVVPRNGADKDDFVAKFITANVSWLVT